MEAANGHIHILDGMAALGNHYRASFIGVPGRDDTHPGYVLHLTIAKTREIFEQQMAIPTCEETRQASELIPMIAFNA